MGNSTSTPAPPPKIECEVCGTEDLFGVAKDNTLPDASLSSTSSKSNSRSVSTTATTNSAVADDNHNYHLKSLRCRLNHYLCSDCTTNYINVTFINRPTDPGVDPQLECSHPGCGIVFREHQIAQVVDEATFKAYLDHRLAARDGMVLANMRQQLAALSPEELENQNDIDRQILAKQLQKQLSTTTAISCPRCNFGPIIAEACWDLAAHHQSTVGNNRPIDNRCPSCGFFDRDRKKWKLWDGKLHNPQKAAKVSAEQQEKKWKAWIVGGTLGSLFLAYNVFWTFVVAFIIAFGGFVFALNVQDKTNRAQKKLEGKKK